MIGNYLKIIFMLRNSIFYLLIISLFSINSSCIPVKIAPNIDTHRVMLAKKFKRKLPRETSFIFEDPKDAYAFYDYVNTKFQLKHQNVGLNTPFQIEGKTYYLNYKEAEKTTNVVNLPLILIDAKRSSNGNSSLFENSYVSRKGQWYLVLSVHDDNFKNCLLDDYENQDRVIDYLEYMRQEYLNTENYKELHLTQQ